MGEEDGPRGRQRIRVAVGGYVPKVGAGGSGVEATGQEEALRVGAVEEWRDTLDHATDILGMAAVGELVQTECMHPHGEVKTGGGKGGEGMGI